MQLLRRKKITMNILQNEKTLKDGLDKLGNFSVHKVNELKEEKKV
jgi:hypothetical protein